MGVVCLDRTGEILHSKFDCSLTLQNRESVILNKHVTMNDTAHSFNTTLSSMHDVWQSINKIYSTLKLFLLVQNAD